MTEPANEIWVERHVIPSDNLGGWAIIFIDQQGTFSTVSDYGSYGYIWTHPGMPFRQFLQQIEAHYLMGKLAGGKREYQGERTVAKIRQYLADVGTSPPILDQELELLQRHNDLCHEHDYLFWCEDTSLDVAGEEDLRAVYDYPIQLQQFCQKVWPKFVAKLKECP